MSLKATDLYRILPQTLLGCPTHVLDAMINQSSAPGYPPYDIEAISENDYVISLAVAGFTEDDLSITQDQSTLTVSGSQPRPTTERNMIHTGIARRDFSRTWQLAEHVIVENATHENGLLNILLKREVPPECTPRVITVTRK